MRFANEKEPPFYQKPLPLCLYTLFILFAIWGIYSQISNSYVSISLRAASFYNSEVGVEIALLEKENGELNNLLKDQTKIEKELQTKVRNYSTKIKRIKAKEALIGEQFESCSAYVPSIMNCTSSVVHLRTQYDDLAARAQVQGVNVAPTLQILERDLLFQL